MTASLTEQVQALRCLPLFADIELSKLKLLAFTSEPMRFADGDVLFHQDDPSHDAHVIMNGRVDLVVDTAGGPFHLSSHVGNGIVGEIGILCGRTRIGSAVAVGEVSTLRIGRDAFFRLMEEFPQIAVPMLRDLALRLDLTTRELSRRNRG